MMKNGCKVTKKQVQNGNLNSIKDYGLKLERIYIKTTKVKDK